MRKVRLAEEKLMQKFVCFLKIIERLISLKTKKQKNNKKNKNSHFLSWHTLREDTDFDSFKRKPSVMRAQDKLSTTCSAMTSQKSGLHVVHLCSKLRHYSCYRVLYSLSKGWMRWCLHLVHLHVCVKSDILITRLHGPRGGYSNSKWFQENLMGEKNQALFFFLQLDLLLLTFLHLCWWCPGHTETFQHYRAYQGFPNSELWPMSFLLPIMPFPAFWQIPPLLQ